MKTCLSLLMLALRMLSPNHSDERSVLTFEQRLQAREAIARVQYGHQLEATRHFEQAVPRWALRREVRDMLEQSAALEELWGVRVTPEMLQGEAARIARDTRLPERLAELHAALGDDTSLIQEALVRPVLVSRLFHERFDRDPVIQAGPRQQA